MSVEEDLAKPVKIFEDEIVIAYDPEKIKGDGSPLWNGMETHLIRMVRDEALSYINTLRAKVHHGAIAQDLLNMHDMYGVERLEKEIKTMQDLPDDTAVYVRVIKKTN